MAVRIEHDTRIVGAVPAISASAAYAAGDAIGGKIQFSDVVRSLSPAAPLSGIIVSASIIDLAAQNSAIDLELFSGDFTGGTDNAAFDPDDAELFASWIGRLRFLASDYASWNDSSAATILNLVKPIKLAEAGILYGQLVSRGTPTYASVADLKVLLDVIQD